MISKPDPTVDCVLDDLVDEIVVQLQNGNDVDIDRMAAENPQVGDQLRKLHSTLKALICLDQTLDDRLVNEANAIQTENQTLGDFRIIRQLGRGGMGVVYEARQLSIDRAVALKILPFAALVDSKALQRFRNEVAAIATLEHPHIVSVYAVGEERGVHFYAMQLVRGQSLAVVIRELRSRIDQNGSLTGDAISQVVSEMAGAADSTAGAPAQETRDDATDDEFPDTRNQRESATRSSNITDQTYFRNIIRLILQSAEALQHAHDHGIIHRDIKPGNLLLDVQGSLFVTDFGLARIETEAGMTMTGDVLGTLRYMSPEQVLANRVAVDHRTDVYSLGATLYELLTLRPMWAGNDKPEIIRKISFEEPPKMRRINSAIPVDLETIVLKAISKNANDRYDSARSFADDLQAFLDHKPIVARRTTFLKHISKWAYRQRRVLAIAASAALLALSIGLVLTWNAWQGESVQRSRAQSNYRMALGTLDELVNNAAEHERMIDLEGWRRQTLEKAISYYTRFAEQNQSDPDTALLLHVQDKLAKVNLLLENYPAAAEAAEEGLAIGSDLRDGDGSVEEMKIRGLLWRRLGNAYQELGQSDQAGLAWNKAHDHFEKILALDSANSLESLISVAEFLRFFSEWQMAQGDPRTAIKSLSRAANLVELGAGSDPQAEPVQMLLCEISEDLGDCYVRGNRRQDSLENFQDALDIAKVLGNSRSALQLKAKCYRNLGVHFLGDKKTRENAIQSFHDAIAICEQLIEDYPWDVYYRGELAGCQHNLALALKDQGAKEEALELLRQAQKNQSLAVKYKSRNSKYQLFWAKHKKLAGEIAWGLEERDQAEELFEECEQHLLKLVERWPEHRQILTNLIALYQDRCELISREYSSFGDLELLGSAEQDAKMSLELLDRLKRVCPEYPEETTGIPRLDYYSRHYCEAWSRLGHIYHGTGEFEKAMSAILKARSYLKRVDDSASPKVRFEMGLTLSRMGSILLSSDGNSVEAETHIRDAMNLIGSSFEEEPLVAKNKNEYLEIRQRCHFMLGMALYEQGRYRESREEWEQGIEVKSPVSEHFSQLLHMYMEELIYAPDESHRDYQRATEIGELVLELEDEISNVIHMATRDRAIAFYRMGNYAEAKRILGEMMVSESGGFSYTMGYYFAMTLERLDPADDDGPFYKKDAKVSFYLTEDKLQDSGKEMDDDIKLLRAEARELLGIANDTMQQVLFDQANCCQAAGFTERAIPYWQELIEIDPGNAVALASLGHCLLNSNQFGEAIPILRQAISLSEDAASIYFDLACACALCDEIDEAFAALNQAIDQEFNSVEQLQENQMLESLRNDTRYDTLLQRIKSLNIDG